MTKVIEVKKQDVRIDPKDEEVDPGIAQLYVDVLNGLARACDWIGEFREGHRNTVALDLTVSSYMLGLDPIRVLDKFVELKLIDPEDDDEDTYGRVYKAKEYWSAFDKDYMIDADTYARYASYASEEDEDTKLFFKLV